MPTAVKYSGNSSALRWELVDIYTNSLRYFLFAEYGQPFDIHLGKEDATFRFANGSHFLKGLHSTPPSAKEMRYHERKLNPFQSL